MATKTVLVTGGAGYIGSHTVLQLLLGGYKAVIVDNYDNSSETAVKRVKELAGEFAGNLSCHKVCAAFYLLILFALCFDDNSCCLVFLIIFISFGIGFM